MTAAQIRAIVQDFKRNWTPSGAGQEHLVKAVQNVRPSEGLERCCACVCQDPQSGVIYCGDLAVLVADVVGMDGCVVALCDQHKGRMKDYIGGR